MLLVPNQRWIELGFTTDWVLTCERGGIATGRSEPAPLGVTLPGQRLWNSFHYTSGSRYYEQIIIRRLYLLRWRFPTLRNKHFLATLVANWKRRRQLTEYCKEFFSTSGFWMETWGRQSVISCSLWASLTFGQPVKSWQKTCSCLSQVFHVSVSNFSFFFFFGLDFEFFPSKMFLASG